jgi:transcriptional regulator with GAF, ATPase, and Fis domain
VVYDSVHERVVAVARHLAGIGATLLEAGSPTRRHERPADAALFLVGLADTLPTDASVLDWIALCRRTAPVIAYAHGADGWPIRFKAEALLAGCTTLVDLAASAAGHRLEDVVGSVLARELRGAAERDMALAALAAGGLVGTSAAMLEVGRWLARVAPLSDTSALITGETGTGKELVARAIHQLDPRRRSGPYVPVNCAALSPGLAESDLFGHRRGAFTGAESARTGFVRSARGGVLLLDEVGDLEPALQAKLLRVLQDRRVVALGEDRESDVDVRVIAATNRDLEAAVDAGTFRRDLYHRLSILTVRLPPLRERREDIAPLVSHFLTKHARTEAAELDFDALQAIRELEFPGNVRELENLVRAALAGGAGSPIGLGDLPPVVLRQLLAHGSAASPGPPGQAASDLDRLADEICRGERTLDGALEECERALLRRTLDHTHLNQAGAARLLGVSARAVYRKLRRLGLHD